MKKLGVLLKSNSGKFTRLINVMVTASKMKVVHAFFSEMQLTKLTYTLGELTLSFMTKEESDALWIHQSIVPSSLAGDRSQNGRLIL